MRNNFIQKYEGLKIKNIGVVEYLINYENNETLLDFKEDDINSGNYDSIVLDVFFKKNFKRYIIRHVIDIENGNICTVIYKNKMLKKEYVQITRFFHNSFNTYINKKYLFKSDSSKLSIRNYRGQIINVISDIYDSSLYNTQPTINYDGILNKCSNLFIPDSDGNVKLLSVKKLNLIKIQSNFGEYYELNDNIDIIVRMKYSEISYIYIRNKIEDYTIEISDIQKKYNVESDKEVNVQMRKGNNIYIDIKNVDLIYKNIEITTGFGKKILITN